MGLGALGIAGGIGRGITAGMKDRAAQREADQIARVRQAQLDELTRQQQMRAEEANAVGDINSDAQSRVSASKSRAAGIANSVAQGNADAAMAEDIGNAVKAGAAVKLGCDHTHYPAHVTIAPETLASLAGDLQ